MNAIVAADVKELLEEIDSLKERLRAIEDERLDWAMACECYCPACKALDKLIRTGGTSTAPQEPK